MPDRDATTIRGQDRELHQAGYRLLVIIEGQDPVPHALPLAGEVSMGRSRSADITIDDPQISRVHAILELSGTPAVKDLGSANGTIVRGARVDPESRCSLAVGDVIELGTTLMILQRAFAAEEDKPAPRAVPKSEVLDDAMARLDRLVRRIANSKINVLLLGETGAGKEVTAQKIHALSSREFAPFVGLNCAALSETLFESELFGHERGAFTGANATKPGLIESAEGGTVFLDEVGEMPGSIQAKLLRVLEERTVHRLGSLEPRPVDVRIVAATNRDLDREVREGRFREDLFYRLNGITLVVPPLRERRGEIESLAHHFIAKACEDAGLSIPTLHHDALEWMRNYDWPGNVRQLKNCIHRAVLLCSGGVIVEEHLVVETTYAPRNRLGAGDGFAHQPSESVRESEPRADGERQRIMDALASCGGNQTRAAKMLGISRRTLTNRLNAYQLPRPRKK